MDLDSLAGVCPVDIESVNELYELLTDLDVQEAAPNLLWNVLIFGRLLRGAGLHVTPSQIQTMLQALAEVDWSKREDVYYAAQACCVSHGNERAIFDYVFNQFWRNWRTNSALINLGDQPLAQLFGAEENKQVREARKDALQGEGKEETNLSIVDSDAEESAGDELSEQKPDQILIYSPREVLRKKDFSNFSDTELAEARHLLTMHPWTASRRRSRRWLASKRGPRLDQRRTVREAVRGGGEVRDLKWKKQGTSPRPLVVICDISGSMDRYTRLLLHFLHTLARGTTMEAFVFSTRLTRITPLLSHRNADAAIKAVRPVVDDWSGGTRIGEAIAAFNRRWARRVLGRGAVVIIISDGWDRGDVRVLGREMAALQRRCHRLIWLNPLLGLPGYQPLTRGMSAALPFIDQFLPVHNIASLETLGEVLATIPSARPVRRKVRIPALPALDDKAARDARGVKFAGGTWPGDKY